MKKYKLEIEQDNDPMNPRREWDNLGTMVCFHKRYDLGDKTDYRSEDYDSWEGLKQGIIENEGEVFILPLYLYDHSELQCQQVLLVVNGIQVKLVLSLYLNTK